MAFRNRSLVLACALCALLPSCRKRAPELFGEPELEQVFYSDDSQWRDEAGANQKVQIQDEKDWRHHWELITGSSMDLPVINFDSHMLLLFNAGKMYPGDRIRIHEIEPGNGALIAYYSIVRSEIQESEVYPVQVVKLRKQDARVVFEQRNN